MKKFLVVMFVVLFAATSAYAVDFQTSGMFNTRAQYLSGDNLAEDAVDYLYYDFELDMTTRIVVDDNTVIVVNYEIHDENWGQGFDRPYGNQAAAGWYDDRTGSGDDNIQFKRVFASHNFTQTGTTLDLGLMTGGAWATDFGNWAGGKYRVRVAQTTPIGPIIGILEKRIEEGSKFSSVDDAEKDDNDAYFLAMVTKLGPVNFKPLFGYIDNSAAVLDRGNDGVDVYTVQLGFDGAYDGWGFESDFIWLGYNYNGIPLDDEDIFGAYGNVWFNLGAAKIGGLIAYGSVDNDRRGFGFGDDFGGGGNHILGNWIDFGESTLGSGSTSSGEEIQGATEYRIYVDYAATEALSFNGGVAYVDSNWDVGYWKDADAWEFGAGLSYKISDAVTYSAGAAYADVNLEDSDPDGVIRLQQKFQINF
jgi:hypothetical protein